MPRTEAGDQHYADRPQTAQSIRLHLMRPPAVAAPADGVAALDDLGGVTAVAGHVVADGADLAAAVEPGWVLRRLG
jgi:hypothetical protein